MANDDYLDMLASLGISGSLPPLVHLVQVSGSNWYQNHPTVVEPKEDESPAIASEAELARLERALDLTNMEYEEVKEVVSEWADYMAHKENTQVEAESSPIESPPFFITVKSSKKGKKAGVEEREDGLYLGDVKISDREILVK